MAYHPFFKCNRDLGLSPSDDESISSTSQSLTLFIALQKQPSPRRSVHYFWLFFQCGRDFCGKPILSHRIGRPQLPPVSDHISETISTRMPLRLTHISSQYFRKRSNLRTMIRLAKKQPNDMWQCGSPSGTAEQSIPSSGTWLALGAMAPSPRQARLFA